MAKEFKLPELGENIESADVTRVLVKVGDKIEVDQTIMEIETDKATVEVPSSVSGTIKEVSVKPGDKAKVGQVILVVEESQSNGKSLEEKKEAKPEPAAQKAEQKEEKPKEEKPKEQPKAEANITPKTEQKGGQVEFILPALGENIESAKVVAVKVKDGDKVEKDQIILEIETDKATIEVPSDVSGVVKNVNVKEGENAKVGQIILVLEGSDGKSEPVKEEQKATGRLEEAEKGGAKIKESDVVSTDKAAEKMKEEKPAQRELEVKKGDAKPLQTKTYIEERPSVDPSKLAPAAPTVRRFAREIGVDINKVIGTGPGGRVSIPDVKAYARDLSSKQAEAKEKQLPGIGIQSEPLPDFKKWGAVEVKEMSNIRRKTAEHLSYAWLTVPQVTQYDKADITELEKLRKAYSARAEAAGGKLTVTSILIKIIASALKTFPQFNSSIDMANSSVIYKKYYHIGVAVDTDRGLLVPVVRDVDKKNIIEISAELNTFAEKARNRKLALEDMQGGTFSISNLGGIGGTYFSPIVNTPEVAILGVSRGNYEPVYIDGKFEPRMMLPLSLSYDHRIIDGADAIRFLRWVVNAIQQPFLLALEG